jgi:hypothetical protein
MKVVQELIGYFAERGKLTRKQLKQFVAKGYWGQYTSADLRALERRLDENFFFQVTGETHGPLWGTDVYTSDSDLGTACVHAGLLRPGEAGVVRVTMVEPLPVFKGSSRHGVASRDWNTGWSGAYRVELLRA